MAKAEYPTFCCSYPFNGAEWGFDLKAKDAQEAEERLRAIATWGRVDGQVALCLRAPGRPGFWAGFAWALVFAALLNLALNHLNEPKATPFRPAACDARPHYGSASPFCTRIEARI